MQKLIQKVPAAQKVKHNEEVGYAKIKSDRIQGIERRESKRKVRRAQTAQATH